MNAPREIERARTTRVSGLGGIHVASTSSYILYPLHRCTYANVESAHSGAPPEVHQLSVATCQPAAGRESTLGPLGHLSTKFDRYDVRMHSSGCWNDAPTRRASGRDLRPATPTAGSVSFLTLAARAAATIPARLGRVGVLLRISFIVTGVVSLFHEILTYCEICNARVTEACRL